MFRVRRNQRHSSAATQIWWSAIGGILAGLLLPLLGSAGASAGDGLPQLPPRPSGRVADINRNPSLPPDRSIYVTYGGNVILRFPNYDIRTVNYRDGSLAGEGSSGGVSVVFHNDAGMWWNGGGFYVGPGYSYELLTENRYLQGIVGAPNMRWPALASDATRPVTGRAPDFPPLVGYRAIDEADVEGRLGPNHSPLPMPQVPPIGKPIGPPLKPILGLDGAVHYVPIDRSESMFNRPHDAP